MSDRATTKDPCEQQANAAAWVLGALDDADAPAYATHIEDCRHCQHEIANLAMVRDALPLAVEQIGPPPELRDRIMGVVSAEAQLLRAAGPQADRPESRNTSRWAGWLQGWRGGVALGAVLAAGFIVGSVVTAKDQSQHLLVTMASVSKPDARARMIVEGSRAKLQLANFPDPPKGKVYEVWIMRKHGLMPTPTNTLFTIREDGYADVTVPYPVHPGDKVLVTAEDSGGADAPTSTPVISAQA
jgi:anti-sigma-K factor RskA